MFADRVFSLTRKGTLKAFSGQLRSHARVIPFPGSIESQEARGVGS
jgi:hypothetical protein